jgi:hypothetical protein
VFKHVVGPNLADLAGAVTQRKQIRLQVGSASAVYARRLKRVVDVQIAI